MSNVPLVDLGEQHRQVAAEVAAGFEEVMASTAFVLGEQVAEFEREYAQFSGVEHCVGVANGTDALEMILRATGIGDGDEVILPPTASSRPPRRSCGRAPGRSWSTPTPATT